MKLIIVAVFIAFSILLVWYLLHNDHGKKEPTGMLWKAFGFGILAIVITSLLEAFLLPEIDIENTQSIPITTLLLTSLAIGIIEEGAKFVPMALYIRSKSYFTEHNDGIIYFAICGLVFGLVENIIYTLTLDAWAGVARLLITPFFHAASTGILGYYLASSKIDGSNKKLIIALIVVPLLHALYDFGLFSRNPFMIVISLMITLLFTMGLFLYYMRANDFDKAALVWIAKKRSNYCIKCGMANSRRTNYCEHCGNQL